jgi:hypothetical protein
MVIYRGVINFYLYRIFVVLQSYTIFKRLLFDPIDNNFLLIFVSFYQEMSQTISIDSTMLTHNNGNFQRGLPKENCQFEFPIYRAT